MSYTPQFHCLGMKWHTSLNCLFTIIFGLMRCINKYAIDDVSGLQTQKVSHTTANETMENKNVPTARIQIYS